MGVGKYISTTEAAQIIGVTRTRVIQMLGEGELSGEKINSRAWVIVRSEAEKLARQKYTTGRPRSRVQ